MGHSSERLVDHTIGPLVVIGLPPCPPLQPDWEFEMRANGYRPIGKWVGGGGGQDHGLRIALLG